MYKLEAFFQTSTNLKAIHSGILKAALSGDYDRLLVAVAYVTRRGCVAIDRSLAKYVPSWTTMKKDWLISFDLGLTEPTALEYLANLPNSNIRIPNAEEVINAQLRPRTHFHNKVYIFEREGQGQSLSMFSGSANLTFGGLYLNDEQGIYCSWSPPLSDDEQSIVRDLQNQKQILEYQFSTGTPFTEALLDRYRQVWIPRRETTRHFIEDENDIVTNVDVSQPVVPQDQLLAIALARYFWIDVDYVVPNRGNGLPGNQIDLKRGSRVFFGFSGENIPKNTLLGSVRIRYLNNIDNYSMRFGNNSMDKLNLPIPGNPGPATYKHTTLLFERGNDGSFVLSIGTPEEVATWKEQSRNQNTLFSMRGGREFGVFS